MEKRENIKMQDNSDAPKSKRKRVPWTEDGELAIIEIWAERVADLRGARKNGHIYAEMANELAKLGHIFSARDVQVKVANFTQRYRKEKLGMGPSGGSPSTWPFYGRVHQIIGGFKANLFNELTMETISEFDVISKPSPLTPSSPLPPPSPLLSPSPPIASPSSPASSSPMPRTSESAKERKKKKDSLQIKVIEKFEDISTEISKHLERSEENEKEIIKIEREKAEALKEMANDNKELKNGILCFLNRNK